MKLSLSLSLFLSLFAFLASTSARAQSIGDTRYVAATTHRVTHSFVTKEYLGQQGSHDWSRDEHLNNQCYGSVSNNSGWTSPFSTIYNTEWTHFVKSETLVVPAGKQGYVEDTKEYTVYSTTNLTTAATELLGGEIYSLVWAGGEFQLQWVAFAWSRSEITWSNRTAIGKLEDANIGGGGGGN